jgi:hypothetical protein
MVEALYKSLESSLRVFETMELQDSRVGEYKIPWQKFRRVDVGRRVRFVL